MRTSLFDEDQEDPAEEMHYTHMISRDGNGVVSIIVAMVGACGVYV